MKKLPSIRNLQYLIKLYELGNFKKAADACFVSQSTVSTGIQNLEDQLGGLLIERDNKSFLFTEFGLQVLGQAKIIVQNCHELLDISGSNLNDMQTRITLGCIPTITPFMITPLFELINQQYPLLTLTIKEDTTENLLKSLDEGEVDILLLALPVDIGHFSSKVIGKDYFKLVASQSLQLTEPVDYETLPDSSVYLLQKEHCLTKHAVSACNLVNKAKINPFYASSIHSIIQMIKCQTGSTFLPQMAIKSGILTGCDLHEYQTENSQDAYREIGLVWRSTSRKYIVFSKLGDLIKQILLSNQS